MLAIDLEGRIGHVGQKLFAITDMELFYSVF